LIVREDFFVFLNGREAKAASVWKAVKGYSGKGQVQGNGRRREKDAEGSNLPSGNEGSEKVENRELK
jgi:hypothetical protein